MQMNCGKALRPLSVIARLSLCVAMAGCPAVKAPNDPSISLDSFPPMATGSAPGASEQAWIIAKSLGRGVNFGNMLEAPTEGAWGVRVEDSFYDKVVEAGFQSVRLPVRWSNHASLDAAAQIDEGFGKRVDAIIDELLKRHLTVIVNMHHYRQLDGDSLDSGEMPVDPRLLQVRFLNMWSQIAVRYRDKPANLVFELYNEPHGDQNTRWNELAARALQVVRQSNPKRVVMIGPTQWNIAQALHQLTLPNDPELIVTVHNYEPFQFTHQGAEWLSGSAAWQGSTCCSPTQQEQMRAPLDIAAQWSRQHRYPIYLGEFGAYGKAPMASRQAFTRIMRDEAERRGMSWGYWEFGAGFGVYDPGRKAWRTPIMEALLGQ